MISDHVRVGAFISPNDPFWVQVCDVVYRQLHDLGAHVEPFEFAGSPAAIAALDPDILVEEILARQLKALICNSLPDGAVWPLLHSGLRLVHLSESNPYGIELPDALLQDLQYIYHSGVHLNRIINDLLDLSRAEIGALDLYPEAIEPRSFLEEVFNSMARSAEPPRLSRGTYACPNDCRSSRRMRFACAKSCSTC